MQFYAGIVTLLNGQQAQGCAIGLLPDGDGDFTSSVLTVSTVTFPGISPRLVLADLMGATSGKMQEGLRPMELPCGPGFLMERTRSAPIPGRADNEAGGPSDGRVWQGTVAVPVSGSHSIVMVQLVTAARDLADNYRDILRGVAYTLTFNDPNADQGIADERHTGSDDTTSPFG
ncbi:hypothetical protein GTY65_36500 [Streptomyces sp. SID8379]|uniref:hypothetical protein n=1 Tax=unclassified Streptomyces TaxID=2593676 RepID=UPI001319D31D|nr:MULTISPECIES: hypothetical protein [unclassified Streptomyces]MYW69528.1 hypothetical protein [Streptomyces sp. SID8379]